jgi:hypothetical protein
VAVRPLVVARGVEERVLERTEEVAQAHEALVVAGAAPVLDVAEVDDAPHLGILVHVGHEPREGGLLLVAVRRVADDRERPLRRRGERGRGERDGRQDAGQQDQGT